MLAKTNDLSYFWAKTTFQILCWCCTFLELLQRSHSTSTMKFHDFPRLRQEIFTDHLRHDIHAWFMLTFSPLRHHHDLYKNFQLKNRKLHNKNPIQIIKNNSSQSSDHTSNLKQYYSNSCSVWQYTQFPLTTNKIHPLFPDFLNSPNFPGSLWLCRSVGTLLWWMMISRTRLWQTMIWYSCWPSIGSLTTVFIEPSESFSVRSEHDINKRFLHRHTSLQRKTTHPTSLFI